MTLRALLCCSALLVGCADDDAAVLADASDDASAAAGAKALLVADTGALFAAVTSLCTRAPTPLAGGWSDASDPGAVAAMRADWRSAHQAYQGLEGAVSLLFPALAAALDGRYEQALMAGPDDNAFDREGFVGLHAVERILWADAIPPGVVAVEAALPGYQPASFPSNNLTATEFHDELCARLVSDAATLDQQIRALALGSPDGYAAGLRTVTRQVTKVEEAGLGFDESRYANTTLADMRTDVAAARAMHAAFAPWLLRKLGGPAVEAEVTRGFDRLDADYTAIKGDGMPAVPSPWSAVDPSSLALEMPFGKLFEAVRAESDASRQGSLAGGMSAAAATVGIAERPAQA